MHRTCQKCGTRFDDQHLPEPYRELGICKGCCRSVLAAAALAGEADLHFKGEDEEHEKPSHEGKHHKRAKAD